VDIPPSLECVIEDGVGHSISLLHECGIDAAAQVMVIDQLLAKSGAEDV